MEALARLTEILDDERRAAIAGDLDLLESIAEDKRAAFDALASAGVRGAEMESVAARARANVALLRNLVEVHRALAGSTVAPGYDARGLRAVDARPTVRLRRST